MPTATQALADHLLDGGLEPFVAARRLQRKSWRRIALDLRDAVGVDVTHETVRSWFKHLDDEVAA